MSNLIALLTRFNRKERFLLIGTALGNASFLLSKEYRDGLTKALGINVPQNSFSAMDYHFTWLYASVMLADSDLGPDSAVRKVFDNRDGIVRGNQEDIDLLVAFDEDHRTHVIIVEAKGVTGWTNRQMASKANRLREIFGDAGDAYEGIIPHFVLTSPRESLHLSFAGWPRWMIPNNKIPWIELKIPDRLIRVSRCDESGKPAAAGRFWTVLPS